MRRIVSVAAVVASVARGIAICAVALLCVALYTAGSVRRLAIRDREARARHRSRQRGRLLRWSFERLGATFVKIGQVMSARADLLAPAVIEELRGLQDRVRPFAFRDVRAIVERELNAPLESVFESLDAVPLAAGSIAQVHHGVLRSGEEIAIKVLRPDVTARIRRDARLLLWLAHVAYAVSARARAGDVIGHVRNLIAGIIAQTDLRREADNYELFRASFTGVPGLGFPGVHRRYSTRAVLTMEMIHGVHLERVRPEQVDQVTRVLRETFFAMCFEHGLVHADLHPGNVLVRPAGTVVLVDLGLVKHLDPDAIGKLVDLARCLALGSPQDLVLVVVNLDPHHTHRAWLDLDLNVLGIDADHTFQVHDLLTGARFSWRGPRNFVELVPHEMPGHIFEVRRFARSENQFEYTAGEHWQPLVQLLLDRASRTGEFEPLIAVAHLNEDKLADPGAAFLVWLTVFRREPTRAHLIEQLDRLAGRAGDWNELLTETRSLAEELEPAHPGAAAQLWQMIGTWLRDRLRNRDAAAAPFERAARLNPDATDQAAELLRSDGRWMELIALLLRRAEAEPDAKRRSELYGEVAEIYETKLGQPGEAIAWYERAAAGDPRSSTFLVALHRLYLDSEAWEVLGELLPRLIEVLGPDAPRAVIVDLQVELGTILADHLGRPDDAIESFRDALALDPKHVPALQGLAKVYQDTGQTEALLETSEAEVDASSPAEQARRYADIAAAWHELARLDRAIACWHKLLALEPRNPHAHKGLARALRDDEQWAELANALRAQLKIIDEPFERVALLLELADLLERSLDHVDGAIGAYREVLAVDARNRAATSTQLEPLAQAIAAELPKRLARPSAEALLHLVHRLPEQTDLVRWGNAVDAAAQRAGLLIAGDLAATARMVASGAAVAGGLRPNQRVTELVAYSVSPAYFAVRRHLGLAIE